MTKKQLILLFIGLSIISAVLLIASLVQDKHTPTVKPTTANSKSENQPVELATMEVILEKIESQSGKRNDQSTPESTISEDETDEAETESKSRLEMMYGSLSAKEMLREDTIELDPYRPDTTGLPPEIIGLTDDVIEAVDGHEGMLIAAAQVEAFRQKPGIKECRIEVFQVTEDAVMLNLCDGRDVIGILVYRPSTATFEGSTTDFPIGG